MAVGRVPWSSVTLSVFLVLFHLHSSFFDVETLGEAKELRGIALECTIGVGEGIFPV